MNQTKKHLRRTKLAKRNALSEKAHKTKSRQIKQRLFSLQDFKKAKTIAFFYGIRKEVHTAHMIQDALNAGKRVLLPRCAYEKKEMHLLEIKSLNDLEKRKFGLMEPKGRCKKAGLKEIDLIIVPAVAFDLDGHRIGYGHGYYDRLLRRKECKAKIIGLCFELQLVKKLPIEKHDVAVDKIITEKRAINSELRRMNKLIAWLIMLYSWFLSQFENDSERSKK
ncbi:MAG: 5-formyltetrahydrofolate cyclo-ligase [archaeon]